MVTPGRWKAVEVNARCAGILILIGMAVYGAVATAQALLPEEGKKVNPKQALIDELLREPSSSPRLREAKEKGYIRFLRSTPGEDVSKYDRGERMTDAEFRSVRQRIAHMYQVEGNAVGRLALGEGGRFFLQPMLTSINMYEIIRHSSTQLNVVYIEGLAVQPVARIEKGGGISRKDSVIKDWALPQFPVQWPFLDNQQCPIFPTAEMFKGGDLVVAKDPIPAPPVPADALGWVYPLQCGGMLGADSKNPPPAGDLLWVRPRQGGGLTIEYSGPNKTGVYAWCDGRLRIHWIQAPALDNLADQEATYWASLVHGYANNVEQFLPLPPSCIVLMDLKNFDSPVFMGKRGGIVSNMSSVRSISQAYRAKQK